MDLPLFLLNDLFLLMANLFLRATVVCLVLFKLLFDLLVLLSLGFEILFRLNLLQLDLQQLLLKSILSSLIGTLGQIVGSLELLFVVVQLLLQESHLRLALIVDDLRSL